ncbi:MAG: hypothetical protein VKP57_02720 [Candidatus Sericytochromatia bacterium]|nr:hypothetical protein [Candidatus Sericytochromatia bacterium]
MFNPDLRVLSPSGFLKRIGATGELPPVSDTEAKEPAPTREEPSPRSSRTRDGFSGSRNWQAAIDRMGGSQAKPGANAPEAARTQAAPRATPEAPARFQPETGKPEASTFSQATDARIKTSIVAQYIHGDGRSDIRLPEDLARKLAGDPGVRRALELLVSRGIADKSDSRGVTVLDHLRAILALPATTGRPSPMEVVRGLVDGLLSPDGIQQGKGTFSCTAATIQGIMASTSPGEYVRVVRGLMFEGQVRTQGGDLLEADLRGLAVNEGRNAVEDVFQESVMSFGKALGTADGSTSYGNGSFGSGSSGGSRPAAPTAPPAKAGQPVTPPPAKPVRRWGNDKGGGADGLTSAQFSGIVQSLTGQKSAALEPSEGFKLKSMTAIFRELLQTGPVAVGIAGVDDAGQATMHAVRVTSHGNGTVTFEDSGTGASRTVSEADFHARLRMVMVPFEDYDRLAQLDLGTTLRTMPSGGGGGGAGSFGGRMLLK